MTRFITALFLALSFGFVAACESMGETTEVVVLCADCGVQTGREGCCDADAARCDGCGKIKGSEGCCQP